jgi:hypothetical protein
MNFVREIPQKQFSNSHAEFRQPCCADVLNPSQLLVSAIDLAKNDPCWLHGEAGGQPALQDGTPIESHAVVGISFYVQ